MQQQQQQQQQQLFLMQQQQSPQAMVAAAPDPQTQAPPAPETPQQAPAHAQAAAASVQPPQTDDEVRITLHDTALVRVKQELLCVADTYQVPCGVVHQLSNPISGVYHVPFLA
jgi:hypothetical protein